MPKFKNQGRRFGLLTFTGLLMATALSGFVAFNPGALCPSIASAANPPVTDFCYTTTIYVTNNTGGTLTNYLVMVRVPASNLRSNGYMNPFAEDIYPVTSTVTEIQAMTQDVTSNPANWWFYVPSLPTGITNYTMYSGGYQIHRNNGMGFNGDAGTYVTAAHQAAFNITDNLNLTVFAETNTTHATAAWLASHWSASTGYRLGTYTSSGTTYLRGQVDAQTCDLAWTGDLAQVLMNFANPTLTITATDAVTGTVTSNACNTGLASISTVTEPFQSGISASSVGGYTGVVRDIYLDSNTTPVLRWTFDAASGAAAAPTAYMTETQAATSANSWTAAGTVKDSSGNGYDGTYGIVSSQTNISVSVSNTGSATGGGSSTANHPLNPNVLPTPFGASFAVTPAATAGDSLPLGIGTGINTAATNVGGSRQAVWYMMGALVAIVGMVGIARLLPSAALVLAFPVFTFLGFAFLPGSPVSPMVAFIVGLFAFGAWGIKKVGAY